MYVLQNQYYMYLYLVSMYLRTDIICRYCIQQYSTAEGWAWKRGASKMKRRGRPPPMSSSDKIQSLVDERLDQGDSGAYEALQLLRGQVECKHPH